MGIPLRLNLLVFLVFVSVVGSASAAKKKKPKKPPVVLNDALLNLCPGQAPVRKKADQQRLKWMVEEAGERGLVLTTSPQNKAACWMLYKDKAGKRNRQLTLQRFALVVLHFSSTQGNTKPWDWQMAVDVKGAPKAKGHWLDPTKHECNWYGVQCYFWSKALKRLNLGFLKVDGLLPRELGLLHNMKELDLHGNDLQGIVPHKLMVELDRLEYLRLHMNGFFGSLHKEIEGLTNLKELSLFGNYMGSTIPDELANLKNLEVVDMYANFLTGTIPTSLGRMKKLRELDLHDNNLVGTVPRQICDLKLDQLLVDCLGPQPEIQCDCCTVCCRGLPDPRCVDVKTGQEVQLADL